MRVLLVVWRVGLSVQLEVVATLESLLADATFEVLLVRVNQHVTRAKVTAWIGITTNLAPAM